MDRLLLAPLAALVVTAGCFDPDHLPEMTFGVERDAVWPPPPSAKPGPADGEGRIYVTNNLDDTVSIIDLDSALAGAPVELDRVPVGFSPLEREGPHHVTTSSDAEFYYIGISNFVPGAGSGPHGVHGNGTADGHLLKMRSSDNALVSSVRIDRNPGDVRLSPSGRMLIASHFDLLRIIDTLNDGGPREQMFSSLAIVDPRSMTRTALVPACPAAHGIAIAADESYAVTSCYDDEVAIIDLVDPAHPVRRVDVLDGPGDVQAPICSPYAVTLDGDTAWVSCFESGQLIAIDAKNAVRDGRVVQLPGKAVFGDVATFNGAHKPGGPGTRLLAIASQSSDTVVLVDVDAGRTRKLIPVDAAQCVLPHYAKWAPALDAGRELLFLVCEGNKAEPGSFVVIDPTTGAALGSVPLGLYPDDMAVMRRRQ